VWDVNRFEGRTPLTVSLSYACGDTGHTGSQVGMLLNIIFAGDDGTRQRVRNISTKGVSYIKMAFWIAAKSVVP